MGFLIFDNADCRSYGITIDSAAAFDAPERDIETVSIPGRNGDLVVDNGKYKNISVTYPAGITTNFSENAERARAFFLSRSAGYYRLEDSYDTDHYRLGRYSGGMQFTPGFFNFCGQLVLAFDCKPQRFLKSGETESTITNGGTVTNPTAFSARPIITVTGAAKNAVLTIAGKSITFKSAISAATIDCELQECYNGATNLNGSIECTDFPALTPGNNTVSWSGTITSVKITPRWWTL